MNIGKVRVRNRVFLAPMSGVTDEPFRMAAHSTGAGLVVSEMVASEELVRQRRDMVRRAKGAKRLSPFVMQLAGREAHWMAEGAKLATDMGADIIDINMGCPARQVTGGLSGSALMRNIDHAITLIEATVARSGVPVTLKMRLGWDEKTLNAPELARRAQNAGVAMITVHGRTRCQFYKGRADWAAIRAVREAISIPLVANGDCETAQDARAMMQQSGADAVMIGRGAYGRPWLAGVIAGELESGKSVAAPSLMHERDILLVQMDATLSLYGDVLGNKTFRKHVGWTLDRLHQRALLSLERLTELRRNLLCEIGNAKMRQGLLDVFAQIADVREAA
ncbi:MAG: tRNA dihydrouridine synthase DusB [Aestuariivirga sp.]